jgi:hypothetical protein
MIDRIRYWWSGIVAYGKHKAGDGPDWEVPTTDEKLDEIEREATAECLTSLFEGMEFEEGEQSE